MSELKIKVGDKEYDLPDVTADHLIKIIEDEEKRSESEESLSLSKILKNRIDFYYDLLNPYYPELTKKVLGKMPSYQLSGLLQVQITNEYLKPPLDSKPEKAKKESVSKSS